MKATLFEDRHRTLLHLLLVGLAVGAYFLSPDDIVWAVVRHHANRALLERITFGVGTLLLFICAVLETWASAYPRPDAQPAGPLPAWDGPYRYLQHPLLLSRLLFALVLGLLLPLLGTVVLLVGEALLVCRLLIRDGERTAAEHWLPYRSAVPLLFPTLHARLPVRGAAATWGEAFRRAASKWGLAVSMVVFTLTLQDRTAEIGGAISFLVWLMLNLPRLVATRDSS